LLTKQRQEIVRLSNGIESLKGFLAKPENKQHADGKLGLAKRLADAQKQLKVVSDASYVESLVGTAGSEPSIESIASMRAGA